MRNTNKRKIKILAVLFAVSGVTGVFFTNCAQNGFSAASDGSEDKNDPLLEMAWHINNTAQKVFSQSAGQVGNDLNLISTWTNGYTGKGVKVLVSDDGVEDTHEDLKGNFLYGGMSKDYLLPPPYLSDTGPARASDDNHGTSVAGLIAATAANGLGSRGIAFGASLAAANFLSSSVNQTMATIVDQASGEYDIFSMSWGSKQNSLIAPIPTFQAQLKYGSANGRQGKGSIYVKSSGNNFLVECNGSTSEFCTGNANFDSDNSTPYTILTSALNSGGYVASYSSPGSNVWIASFGGELGHDSPAMVTTDRMGCSKGFSQSNVMGSLNFERGGLGNTNCNYTAKFNGTSAAAPVLSGAIALLLEVNPYLTSRDVKYILAKTAIPVQYPSVGGFSHPKEEVPSGYVWEQGWVQNGAGFKFHNWYGFGRVNVDGAVNMAKSYTSSFGVLSESNWVDERSNLNLSVPDNSATGASDTMMVNTNVKIEAVQIKVWITHTDISNLAIELTSPSGTKSIVVNANNALRGIQNYNGVVFLANTFYQERSQGNWKLKVVDAKSTHTGTVTRWSLNFTGSN